MNQAVELALQSEDAAPDPSPAPARPPGGLTVHDLSRRQLQVVALVAQGQSNRQIAEALVISQETAAVHVKHILAKLGFTSRAQIAAWAVGQAVVGNAGHSHNQPARDGA
jgi:DNA-binding NarL/FixJ family response regulator